MVLQKYTCGRKSGLHRVRWGQTHPPQEEAAQPVPDIALGTAGKAEEMSFQRV